MLQLHSDSERTSLTLQVPEGLIRLPNQPDFSAESEKRVVVSYCDVQPTNVLPRALLSPSSARRERFNTSVFINVPPHISVFALNWVGARYLVCGQVTRPDEETVEFQPLVKGPSRASWTTEGCALATGFESAIHAALSELRLIVSAIRQARPLASTPEFEVLLTRAAQAHGTPENIEEWARRIAEDISDLTD